MVISREEIRSPAGGAADSATGEEVAQARAGSESPTSSGPPASSWIEHETVSKEPELRVHSGLMHQHDPREARLIERTLRNGIVPPQVLSSFRDGARAPTPRPFIQAVVGSSPPASPMCTHPVSIPTPATSAR